MNSHEQEYSELYKKSGVDTIAGQNLVKNIKDFVKKTFDVNVLTDLGGFSGIYDLSFLKSYKEPVLLTSTDGVGTKLSYASYFKRFDTIGYDLVAMCANDILVSGGKPAIFLDYLATGKLHVEHMSLVVRSIAAACKMINCSLLGGETAEHPNLMVKQDDFDLAGFIIGFSEKQELITGEFIKEGDVILGIPSSGIHSNGLSLIRKIFFDPALNQEANIEIQHFIKKNILLQPTVLYELILRDVIKYIKGMVHITGGGYFENIPRILKENYYVELKQWKLNDVFQRIANHGNMNFLEMTKVFNCGFGMLIFVEEQNVHVLKESIQKKLESYKEKYIQNQMLFFGEYQEWKDDWYLQNLSTEVEVLGVVKKDSSYSKKVVFIN